jgi:tetratricopeptide (TPR) repeat protein
MRLACVLAVVLSCSVARADQEAAVALLTAAAQDHYKQGEKLYKAEQYPAARIEFQAGYDLSKNPVFLWNLAKASGKMGDRQAALDYVQRYRVTLAAPDPEVDAFAKELIDQAEAPKAPVPQKPTVKKRSPVPWVLLGVGAALLIADIGVGGAGYQLSQSNEGAMLTMAELADLNARGDRLNTAGWSLLGVGLGTAAAGGIWLAIQR